MHPDLIKILLEARIEGMKATAARSRRSARQVPQAQPASSGGQLRALGRWVARHA